jgi:hypothetical protein
MKTDPAFARDRAVRGITFVLPICKPAARHGPWSSRFWLIPMPIDPPLFVVGSVPR